MTNDQPDQIKMVNNWINIIQDYLFPPSCILCGNAGFNSSDICYSCYCRLPGNDYACYRCAEILEGPVTDTGLCGRCLSHSPAFDNTYAPFIYQSEISHLITSLKFNARYQNARLLGTLLADYLKHKAEMPDRIIPVPLHKARYRQRGFNQAIEIARTVSRELHVPLDLASCLRHRDTPHQTGLAAKQRRKNMKNAFSIIKPIDAGHIAVIDDVMTTGTTAHELARLLKSAGVSQVDVWVCARA